jgi:hypothetical protein
MKKFYLIGIVLTVIISSCGNLKEKKEAERKNKELKAQQHKQDSVKFEHAIVLFEEQNWGEAEKAFRNIRNTDSYRTKSLQYLEKIINRPWKISYDLLKTSVKGEFSNSATKDSPLWVEMEFNKKGDIYLYMYEYSEAKPSNRSAEKPMYDFSLYVSGQKNEFLCYKIRPRDSYEVNDATHSEGIRLSGGLAKKIVSTLKNSTGKVYFSITMGNSSTYNFYISSDGFTKEYDSYKKSI